MELGSGEILLILLVALLVYGGRLPEVARAVGRSIADLKRGFAETKDIVASEIEPHLNVDLDEPPREVKRKEPATPEEAKEDISTPESRAARHEHPN